MPLRLAELPHKQQQQQQQQQNSVVLVRKRTILTEGPQHIGEVNANFCG
jgi:hypothetical protein